MYSIDFEFKGFYINLSINFSSNFRDLKSNYLELKNKM